MRAAAALLLILFAPQAHAYCSKPSVLSRLPEVVEYQGCVIKDYRSEIDRLKVERNAIEQRLTALEARLESRDRYVVVMDERFSELLRALTKAGISTTDFADPNAKSEFWWSMKPPAK